MSDTTPRYLFPLLAAGQAQKEILHNEAIAALDILTNPAIEASGVAAPPAEPAIGQAWIVGDDPTGAWAGQAGAIAAWGDGGWRFHAPVDGLAVWRKDHARWIIRHSGRWDDDAIPAQALAVDGTIVVRAQQPAIGNPVAGGTTDSAARDAITAVLNTLRSHGLIAS